MPARPHVAMTLTQMWHRVPGGTATSMSRLAGALVEGGRVQLTGIGPRGEIRRPRSLLDPSVGVARALPDSMAYLPLPLPLLYDAWTRFGRPRITSVCDDADLVHLTVPITPPGDRVPLVVTVHDLFPLTHSDLLSARGVRLMAQGLCAIRDRADRVIVSTRAVADECVKAGFDSERIALAPFGVAPVEVGSHDVDRVLAKYRLQRPYVLYVGTLEPRKNLGLLFEAMVRINDPDLGLVLVGPSGWDTPVVPRGWANVADVPSPVVRLGFVPDEDLPALQHGAAAFCFPSLVEGFGLPVLEAMAAGAVVITSNVGATAEVAGNGAVLVDPGDSEQLATAIRAVSEDDDLAAELRLAAKERSRQFTWTGCAEAVADVYESVIR